MRPWYTRPLSTVPAEPSILPGTGFGSAPCATTSVPPRVGPPAVEVALTAGADVAFAAGPEAGAGDWQAASKYRTEVAAAPILARRMNPRRVKRSTLISQLTSSRERR